MEQRSWKCTICGAAAGSETPPAHCAECGARAAMFVASDEEPHGVAHNPLQPRDASDGHPVTMGPGHGCIGDE